MKKMRKGFTLIELLIVITIIGALAAVMGTSTDKATAQAKAAAIVSNVAACRNAAVMYYAENLNEDLSDTTASTFLEDENYVPGWEDFNAEKGTQYSAGEETGYEAWNLIVDFSKDGDKTGIATALSKIRGYSAVTEGATGFKVTLSSGKVEAN